MTDHRLETTWLTNLFTNSCAGAEKDTATAAETETVTGSRATRKCSNAKKAQVTEGETTQCEWTKHE